MAKLKMPGGAVLCFAFLLNSAALFGQNAPPDAASQATAIRRVTLAEAVDLATQNNLSLQSQAVATATKRRKSDTSWNGFIPNVNAGLTVGGNYQKSETSGFAPSGYFAMGMNQAGNPGPVLGIAPYNMEVNPMWMLQGTLSMSLQLNAALFEGIKNTRLDYEGGLITYEKARLQLERDVRKLYYNILLMQEQRKLQQESYAAAERQEATARSNYYNGRAPELTWLQAQVAKENLKPEIDQTENTYKMLLVQFAMYLGLPLDTEFGFEQLSTDIEAVPLDLRQLIVQAANNKPEILELRQQIALLNSTRKQTFYQIYTPTINLSFNWSPSFGRGEYFGAFTKTDKWYRSTSNNWSVTLGFSLSNLLPWSVGAQGLKEIDDGISTLNIGLAQAVQGTEMEIYNTVLSLHNTQTSIAAMQETVRLAQRSYQSTYSAYQAGLQDFLQVQSAQDQLNQARLGVLAQNFTYILGLIDLEYSIGVPFGTLSGENAEASAVEDGEIRN